MSYNDISSPRWDQKRVLEEYEVRNKINTRITESWTAQNQERTLSIAKKMILPHVQTLALKKSQLTIKDEYGQINENKWEQEINRFIESVLVKDRDIADFLCRVSPPEDMAAERKERYLKARHDAFRLLQNLVVELVKDQQRREKKALNKSRQSDPPKDPIEFEHYCAMLLERYGWKTRVTKSSGDQGIDIIGTYRNSKAVFQCKLYSHPVGNAAVQEIFAGKAFEQAAFAVVITNSSFTPSAKQLAQNTGVLLSHVSDIPTLHAKLGLLDGR